MDDVTEDTEQGISQLRDVLSRGPQAPLGLASRLEASVRAKIRSADVSWEPRLVIACIAYAVVSGTAAAGVLTISVAIAAVAYSRFAVVST